MMGKLTHGSLFTGIGGLDLGFDRAGWECKWQIENDRHCNNVLGRRWPKVERHSDIRKMKGADLEPVELVHGGFPCQDLSVAGKRGGIQASRSGLFFEFARLLRELRPPWCLVENVPGLLSSNGGADFLVLLDELGECGYGVAWRILDSQFFGVPQRRRRVFVVGRLGAPCPPEILFEPEGVRGNLDEGGKEREGTPPGAARGAPISRGRDANPEKKEGIARALLAGGGEFRPERYMGTAIVHTLRSGGAGGIPSSRGRDLVAGTLRATATGTSRAGFGEEDLILFTVDMLGGKGSANVTEDQSPTHGAGGSAHAICDGVVVRRLTPLECERLQGFPDGWTESENDSARYRMLGNAVTVNVAEWVGRRIGDYARR